MIRAIAVLVISRLWIAFAGAGPQPTDSEYDLFDDRLWWREVE